MVCSQQFEKKKVRIGSYTFVVFFRLFCCFCYGSLFINFIALHSRTNSVGLFAVIEVDSSNMDKLRDINRYLKSMQLKDCKEKVLIVLQGHKFY